MLLGWTKAQKNYYNIPKTVIDMVMKFIENREEQRFKTYGYLYDSLRHKRNYLIFFRFGNSTDTGSPPQQIIRSRPYIAAGQTFAQRGLQSYHEDKKTNNVR